MQNQDQLRSTLQRLDNASYKAYKDIKGSYDFIDFKLLIDYVQGDPFAAPSQMRVQVPQSIAGFPDFLYQSTSRQIALRDYLTRQFRQAAGKISDSRGTGKSGLIAITSVGQEILERSSVLVNEEMVEARFVVGLPAKGRRILGRQAAELLCEDIPEIVDQALIYQSLSPKAIRQHVETVEDADWLRDQLPERNLVAFVPNGAILPRRSGVDDRPLDDPNVVSFQSPPELQVSFDCPNRGTVEGMGIPEGITLIVGGGYHGKSTLLQALELGIYNHLPNEGRELAVTNLDAVKIRAEDGRNVVGVDISPFINQLPQGRSTTDFSSPNASGSTSQAANIVEALEAGANVLLVDEDTTATNFMIRDHRMQQLISKDKEPITPFIDKIQQLYQDYHVSTVLVMGGSGDYFDMADTVIAMENYRPYEVTEKAKAIAQENRTERSIEGGETFGTITPRIPLAKSIDPSRGKKDVNVKVRDDDEVSFGSEEIDLAAVEQLVDQGQLRAIAAAIVYAKKQYVDGQRTLPEILDLIQEDMAKKGLDVITPSPQGDLTYFRRFELAAAINRLRTLTVKS
ncbi:MAG: ATPase [Cyanobacteria bacterium SW_9_44_58]|nr:MAG: ATPase [Cyanobacteria bacterium SW_9_44_58]